MVVAKNRNDKRYISNSYIVYGNNAYDLQQYDNFEKTSEDTNKKLKRASKVKLKRKIKTIALIVLTFSIGLLIVARYTLIMNLTNETRRLNNKIELSQKENENLKMQLMDYNDIKEIEEVAAQELNMVHPTNSDVVHISTAAFSSSENTNDEQSKEISFLDKVIELLN